jgi:hypothetical protein
MDRDEIDKRINEYNPWLKPRRGNNWVTLIIVLSGITIMFYSMFCGKNGRNSTRIFTYLYTNDSLKYWDSYNPHINCIGRFGFVIDMKKHTCTTYEYQGKKRITPIYIQGIGAKRIIYGGYFLADKEYWNKTGDSLFDCYEKVIERSKVAKITMDTLVIGESYYIASKDQTSRPIVQDSNGVFYCNYNHVIPFDSIIK